MPIVANAAPAKEGVIPSRIFLDVLRVNVRDSPRDASVNFLETALAGFFIWLTKSTEMIGATLATVNIPKPSVELTAVANPIPMARTNGTVTGPVVTPALSHATAVIASAVMRVNPHARAYLPMMK